MQPGQIISNSLQLIYSKIILLWESGWVRVNWDGAGSKLPVTQEKVMFWWTVIFHKRQEIIHDRCGSAIYKAGKPWALQSHGKRYRSVRKEMQTRKNHKMNIGSLQPKEDVCKETALKSSAGTDLWFLGSVFLHLLNHHHNTRLMWCNASKKLTRIFTVGIYQLIVCKIFIKSPPMIKWK